MASRYKRGDFVYVGKKNTRVIILEYIKKDEENEFYWALKDTKKCIVFTTNNEIKITDWTQKKRIDTYIEMKRLFQKIS